MNIPHVVSNSEKNNHSSIFLLLLHLWCLCVYKKEVVLGKNEVRQKDKKEDNRRTRNKRSWCVTVSNILLLFFGLQPYFPLAVIKYPCMSNVRRNNFILFLVQGQCFYYLFFCCDETPWPTQLIVEWVYFTSWYRWDQSPWQREGMATSCMVAEAGS